MGDRDWLGAGVAPCHVKSEGARLPAASANRCSGKVLVNPNYESTFVFDNDFLALHSDAPKPGVTRHSPLPPTKAFCSSTKGIFKGFRCQEQKPIQVMGDERDWASSQWQPLKVSLGRYIGCGLLALFDSKEDHLLPFSAVDQTPIADPLPKPLAPTLMGMYLALDLGAKEVNGAWPGEGFPFHAANEALCHCPAHLELSQEGTAGQDCLARVQGQEYRSLISSIPTGERCATEVDHCL
ncbi:hypothetical protein JD844_008076 [Phrynosoma platyrhinos]|uniref:Uncharacterized protein n=1 Tax=Phrynosoma platyrhinos TaxID=52577 RepID=A0ABQ7TDE4_PHRPL|nr:hypothetical protein JD844_008076 [Phrynosoma platyrhinos]